MPFEQNDDFLIADALDQLGEWSQIKHEILAKYAHAYTTIVKKQPMIRSVLYIDAFAGCGFGADRDTGEQLKGMKSVEIFYNFMIMDANRNVLWKRPERVPAENLEKMDAVWGDRSWQDAFYAEEPDLFGTTRRKLPNQDVAEAFRKRLKSVAGFTSVPDPIPMKNSNNATVYYLFFASHNETGAKIVRDIVKPYRR